MRLESKNGETTELTDSVLKYMRAKSSEATYLQSFLLQRTLLFRIVEILKNVLDVIGMQMALDLH